MRYNRYMNIMNIGIKLIQAKFLGKEWPVSASVHVTRFCDLKCKHCYAVLETLNDTDPTTKQLEDLFTQLCKNGTVSIRLLGGEPLLRKDLPQLIKKVKSLGMYCEIVTNASILPRRIKEWQELKMVDSICVSLDGDNLTHDSIRGTGSFEKTTTGIEAALDAKLPIRLHGTIALEHYLKSDASPQRFLAEYSTKFGLPFNIATYCTNPSKDEATNKENKKTFELGVEIYKDLLNFKQKGMPVSTSEHILKLGIKWLEDGNNYILYGRRDKMPKGHNYCQAGVRNCFIDSDGNMYSCIPHWKKGISVFDEGGVVEAYKYMKNYRKKIDCISCYNLQQWEYTRLFTVTDFRVAYMALSNFLKLGAGKKKIRLRGPEKPLVESDSGASV